MKTIVVRGVDPSSFAFMDSNIKRTAGDALTILGMPEGGRLESSIRMIAGINDYIRDVGKPRSIRHNQMTRTEIMAFASDWNKELGSVASFICNETAVKVSLGASRSILIAVLFSIENVLMPGGDDEQEYFVRASKNTSKIAREFFSKLALGDGLEMNSPILKLRNRLQTSMTVSKKLATHQKIILIARAWNAIVTGDESKWYSNINKWPGIIWPEDIK